MDKFDYFEKLFTDKLPTTKSYKEAFDEANEEIGFPVYKNYRSFSVVRARKRKRG
jgi:hypothetical protein